MDVSLGFDKTWGQDVLYPQGGLHGASRTNNLLKHRPGLGRLAAKLVRVFDLASYSFAKLERQQYLSQPHRSSSPSAAWCRSTFTIILD